MVRLRAALSGMMSADGGAGEDRCRCGRHRNRATGGRSDGEQIASEAVVYHAPRRLFAGSRRRLLLLALCASVLVLVAVGIAGALVIDEASAVDFTRKNLAPSLAHVFGTDWMGRDMLARTLAGLSTSLGVGLIAAFVSSLIAFLLAVVAAVGGPVLDGFVDWLIDIVMGVPHIVLLILISYALGRGAVGVLAGIALTHWPSLARVLRAEMMQLRQEPFMACSRALGVGRLRMVLNHVLPAVLPQYLVGLALMFPHAILHEASITFLGFGLSPEQPAVGVILSEAMGYLSSGSWWLAVFPGLALLLVVLLFDAVASSLRSLVSGAEVQR